MSTGCEMCPHTHWAEEVADKGSYEALLDRLRFHGGLDLQDAVECTGLCANTVRKHMRRMVVEQKAVKTQSERWRPGPVKD